MRARDLLTEFPTVTLGTLVVDAARLMAERGPAGLIVVSDEGGPHSVLPGTQVLALAVPGHCQDDPALDGSLTTPHRAADVDALSPRRPTWSATSRQRLRTRPRSAPRT